MQSAVQLMNPQKDQLNKMIKSLKVFVLFEATNHFFFDFLRQGFPTVLEPVLDPAFVNKAGL